MVRTAVLRAALAAPALLLAAPAPALLLAASAPALLLAASAAGQPLPPVPEPAENPTTEAKRVLGKILFWDEQLSSDQTVACGTCHRPSAGGADPRSGRHPGADGAFGSRDDTFGSPGVVRRAADGAPVDDASFGALPQVGPRAAPSPYAALWAEALFWDGRAGPSAVDPLSGETVITEGGALEAQALEPLLNPTEMAHDGRAWDEVTDALETAAPLALASDLPPDVAAAIAAKESYPALFDDAFGDPAVTPVRIAFALAAYQRTLVPDQSPWDIASAGGAPLPALAQMGDYWFRQQRCDACHVPPLFTNNAFFSIGLRPAALDAGRQGVTGEPDHAGDMKVPSLRNVTLRPRFMHTGEMTSLDEVLALYVEPRAQRDSLPGGGEYRLSQAGLARQQIRAFLETLTDPRVANEEFPFDRPTLASERAVETR